MQPIFSFFTYEMHSVNFSRFCQFSTDNKRTKKNKKYNRGKKNTIMKY